MRGVSDAESALQTELRMMEGEWNDATDAADAANARETQVRLPLKTRLLPRLMLEFWLAVTAVMPLSSVSSSASASQALSSSGRRSHAEVTGESSITRCSSDDSTSKAAAS